MQEYDSSLKLLLQSAASATIRELTGSVVKTWLNSELPEVRNLRVDLLGETDRGEFLHLELQSTNDPAMPLRMAEYCLRVLRQFGAFPRQLLLYIGEAPLQMPNELRGENVLVRYKVADIRELDGERLLESEEFGDNVIAILARLRDQKAAVRKVLARIAGLESEERQIALSHLLTLAGLRRLEDLIEEETSHMPVLIDIMENTVLGREYKKGLAKGFDEGLEKGLEKGLAKGLEQGLDKGMQAGGLSVIRRQIEKRFGRIPASVEERLAKYSTGQLEELSVRLLDAQSLDELMQPPE